MKGHYDKIVEHMFIFCQGGDVTALGNSEDIEVSTSFMVAAPPLAIGLSAESVVLSH
jgi:hypothetical protein